MTPRLRPTAVFRRLARISQTTDIQRTAASFTEAESGRFSLKESNDKMHKMASEKNDGGQSDKENIINAGAKETVSEGESLAKEQWLHEAAIFCELCNFPERKCRCEVVCTKKRKKIAKRAQKIFTNLNSEFEAHVTDKGHQHSQKEHQSTDNYMSSENLQIHSFERHESAETEPIWNQVLELSSLIVSRQRPVENKDSDEEDQPVGPFSSEFVEDRFQDVVAPTTTKTKKRSAKKSATRRNSDVFYTEDEEQEMKTPSPKTKTFQSDSDAKATADINTTAMQIEQPEDLQVSEIKIELPATKRFATMPMTFAQQIEVEIRRQSPSNFNLLKYLLSEENDMFKKTTLEIGELPSIFRHFCKLFNMLDSVLVDHNDPSYFMNELSTIFGENWISVEQLLQVKSIAASMLIIRWVFNSAIEDYELKVKAYMPQNDNQFFTKNMTINECKEKRGSTFITQCLRLLKADFRNKLSSPLDSQNASTIVQFAEAYLSDCNFQVPLYDVGLKPATFLTVG